MTTWVQGRWVASHKNNFAIYLTALYTERPTYNCGYLTPTTLRDWAAPIWPSIQGPEGQVEHIRSLLFPIRHTSSENRMTASRNTCYFIRCSLLYNLIATTCLFGLLYGEYFVFNSVQCLYFCCTFVVRGQGKIWLKWTIVLFYWIYLCINSY